MVPFYLQTQNDEASKSTVKDEPPQALDSDSSGIEYESATDNSDSDNELTVVNDDMDTDGGDDEDMLDARLDHVMIREQFEYDQVNVNLARI